MMRCLRIAGVLFLSAGVLPCAQAAEDGNAQLDSAVRRAKADTEAALEALVTLRDGIDKERLPLQAAHQALSDSVRERRERLQRLRDAGRLRDEQRLQLEREVSRLEEETRFVVTALSEYRRGMETRASVAELQAFRPVLDRMDAALAAAAEPGESLSVAVAGILEPSLDWNRRRIGGYGFDGTALDGAGTERSGRFLVVGPLAYFADGKGEGSLVTGTPGNLLPSLFRGHRKMDFRAFGALVADTPVAGDTVAGATVAVPVDVSGGAALMRERAAEGLDVEIRKGGFVMVPLLLIGVLSVLISLWKTLRLHSLRRASRESLAGVTRFVEDGKWDEARNAAQSLSPPLSVLIGEALHHRRAPKEHLEEILHEHLLSMLPGWESHLGTLAVFGGVAPLLGLLGTVTGMMHTFELVTLFGTGDARLLSGGISEALITTKYGLGIAIPVLVVHALLVRRVRVIVSTLEGGVARFVNVLSGDAK